jgi:hypothetical protein
VPLLYKDESLSAPGLFQCTSTPKYGGFYLNDDAHQNGQNRDAGVTLRSSFFSPHVASRDEVWMLLHHVQFDFGRSILRKEDLKYSWLSIHIHDPMMKGRSWNLRGMEYIEKSMDPRAKEKHEEEHEDSKKERKSRTTCHYIKNHKTTILV